MDKLIDKKSAEELKLRFEKEIKDTVNVDIFINKGNKSESEEFSVQLLEELAELEPHIKHTLYDVNSVEAGQRNVVNTPTIFVGYDDGYKISYHGAPTGYESASLIETILFVSKKDSGLSETSRKLLKGIKKPVKIDVYVTPTCPYCPKAVMLAQRLAVESKGMISGNMIEAQENMEQAARFNVGSVPQQVVNDRQDSITIGIQPESKFVQQIVSIGS